MKSVKLTTNKGRTWETDINGTDQEISKYYLNNWFNLGIDTDDMHQVIKVEVL